MGATPHYDLRRVDQTVGGAVERVSTTSDATKVAPAANFGHAFLRSSHLGCTVESGRYPVSATEPGIGL
jgi:hypothetical protein